MISFSPSSSTPRELQSELWSSPTLTASQVVQIKVKYFIPVALSRSQQLAGEQQIEGVDQGGGAQHEGQELHNSKSQFCVCQH